MAGRAAATALGVVDVLVERSQQAGHSSLRRRATLFSTAQTVIMTIEC